MSWRELVGIQETLTLPWTGSKHLVRGGRRWKIVNIPVLHGWYRWTCTGKTAQFVEEVDPDPTVLTEQTVVGYLVGDRLITEQGNRSVRIHLVPPGLDLFVRVRAGSAEPDGHLVFGEQTWEAAGEIEAVRSRWLDVLAGAEPTVADIPNVLPGLEQAFRLVVQHHQETEERRRRAQEEERRREEQARRDAAAAAEQARREQERQELLRTIGTSEGRRALARTDFAQAARAALAVSGAVYISHRTLNPGETAVIYRFLGRRFEAVVSSELSIIDAGVCLTAESSDSRFTRGTRGDSWLTLESLPSAIQEASDLGRLVVFRHV